MGRGVISIRTRLYEHTKRENIVKSRLEISGFHQGGSSAASP